MNVVRGPTWILGFSVVGMILIGAGVYECGSEMEIGREIWGGLRPHVHANYTPQWAEGGTSIVFGYEDNIYVVDAGGSNLRRLSSVPRDEHFDYEYSPDVSPDGSRVAYTTIRYGTGHLWNRVHSFDIVTSALDGSDVERPTKDESMEISPVWSPDGTRIAFLSDRDDYTGRFRLYTMGVDGSDVRNIAPSVRPSGDPAVWSPNGEALAFFGVKAPDSEDGTYKSVLYTVGSDGSELTAIWEVELGRIAPRLPTWSPDSSRIAFMRGGDLYVATPQGGNARRLVSDGVETPYWLPDGSEIVYLRFGRLSAATVDEPQVRELANLSRYGLLAWSPDASSVAVVDPAGDVVVSTLTLEGSRTRILVRRNEFD